MTLAKLKMTNRSVLLLTITMLLVSIILIESSVLRYTKGIMSYPFDTVFVSMAIAKNIALHQAWSVAGYEFAPASSSILYPLLLAISFKIFGLKLVIPLFINLGAAISLLVVMQKWLIKEGVNPLMQLVILAAVIFFIPLPVIVVMGMEHTLQALFCFLFVYQFVKSFGPEQNLKETPIGWPAYICSMLAVATRYESLFLIVGACIVLLIWRRWRSTLQLAVFSLLPSLLFGFFSLLKGWYFLPSSVLLKSGFLPLKMDELYQLFIESLPDKFFYAYPSRGNIAVEYLTVTLFLLYFAYRKRIQREKALFAVFILSMISLLLHISLVHSIWFYRYESYLIAVCIPFVATLIAKIQVVQPVGFLKRQWVGLVCSLMLLTPFYIRSKQAFKDVTGICINNFQQQWQLGIFLHRYYDTSRVALSDIGAVSFLTDGKNLDLTGVANKEIMKSKMDGYYSDLFLEWQIRKENVKIIAVFDRLYRGELLQQYKKIAVWHTNELVLPGIDDLCFYSTDSIAGQELKQKIMAFQYLLPDGITVRY